MGGGHTAQEEWTETKEEALRASKLVILRIILFGTALSQKAQAAYLVPPSIQDASQSHSQRISITVRVFRQWHLKVSVDSLVPSVCLARNSDNGLFSYIIPPLSRTGLIMMHKLLYNRCRARDSDDV